MGSPSAIVTLGFGSWGSIGEVVTLGFGSSAATNPLVGVWSRVHVLDAIGRIDIGMKQGKIELKAQGRIEVMG